MNVQQLRYFVTVSQYLCFSEAAKHHYVAQSALSYSIASLEAELGVKLFYRDTRSVKLTEAGTVFLKEITSILNRLDSAIEKVHSTNAGTSGALNVGFLSSLLKQHFSEWIIPFQNKYPNVHLQFEQMYSINLRNALQQELIDVGFTRSFDLVTSPDIEYRKIYDSGCSLIIPKEHHLAQKSSFDFADLAQEPFIIIAEHTSPFWYKKVLQICANRGFMPDFRYTPLSMEMAYTLLNAGLGIGILPDSGQVYNNGNLKFIPLDGDDARVDVVAAWKKGNQNPVLPIFLDEIFVKYIDNNLHI